MLSRGSNCGFTVKNNVDLVGILGLCIPELDGKMSYMIAVTGDNSADIEKYDVITLASSKYMVFEAQEQYLKQFNKNGRGSSLHTSISSRYGKISTIFELYQDGDTTSEKYITEIWMPVKG